MGHGYYAFRDLNNKEEVFQLMDHAHFTAYTEFGVPSPASVEILKSIIPQDELWPPQAGASWESHHAFNSWVGNTWLCQDIIEDYFGKAATLEELVANGQLLQCEGLKCVYEEARRQKPYCSMTANWCYNEPWPTAANNSIINYPDIPKPAFYAVKNACRPVLASAKFIKFQWQEGEIFQTDIWLLNDWYKNIPAGKIKVTIRADNIEIRLLDWEFPEITANTNLAGPTVRFKLPAWKTDRFHIFVALEGKPEYNSEYTLAYKPNLDKPEPKS